MDFKDVIEALIKVLEEEALKIDEEKLRVIKINAFRNLYL